MKVKIHPKFENHRVAVDVGTRIDRCIIDRSGA